MAKKADTAPMQNTTIKVRLDPTPGQAELFEKTFGCCRWLWNHMLADEQRFYQEADVHFIPTPARYKAEAPFLKEVHSGALAEVHQNLRRAFQHFFDNPAAYRHPVFKRKKGGHDSFTMYCQYYPSGKGASIVLTGGGIRLPKAGVVRARLYRKPLHWWKLKSATVSRTPTGKYFCSLVYEYPAKRPDPVTPTAETTLGLNYSLSHFYVDSTGFSPDPPHWMGRSAEKLARLQRRLARMERGSRNYEEQLRKIRRMHEHIANQRKDFIHKESRRIANAWDAVCVKDADLREMSRTIRLGSVMDSGFGQFRELLRYKLERQGKPLILVDRFYPSAKTCRSCGSVNDGLGPDERQWRCPVCGAVHDRGRSGAENLRDQGLAQYYEQQGLGRPA